MGICREQKYAGATIVKIQCYAETIYKFWECVSENKNIQAQPTECLGIR